MVHHRDHILVRDRNKFQNMDRMVQELPLTNSYRSCRDVECDPLERLSFYARYPLLHHRLHKLLPTIDFQEIRNRHLRLDELEDPKLEISLPL